MVRPRPYLDTNLFVDYIRNRNHFSTHLLDTIIHRKIHSFTSYLTILELLDRQQEEKWIRKRLDRRESAEEIIRHRYPIKLEPDELKAVSDDIKQEFDKRFVAPKIVTILTPEESSWDFILGLLARYNISYADAFHVDAAHYCRANIFISNDSDLVTLLNDSGLIPASLPNSDLLEKKLASLKIWSIFRS